MDGVGGGAGPVERRARLAADCLCEIFGGIVCFIDSRVSTGIGAAAGAELEIEEKKGD